MTARLFTSAVFAGLIAGLIAVLLQFTLVEALILEGEEYEKGDLSHFGGVLVVNEALEASGEAAVEIEEEPKNLAKRYALTFFANFIVFVGWGLIMVAGFAAVEHFGHVVTLKSGLLWGIGGFVAVHMAPALGLPPELPGTPAPELELRQFWWLTTVIATALALGFFAFGQGALHIAIGLVLLVAPHLIGAPHLDGYAGLAPPELAGEYVARSLAVSMAIWAVLGLAAGYFWNRDANAKSA